MAIAFGRNLCNNLATAEQQEWLVTNGIGGYAAGTVAGLLTRRYHGLLLAALHPPLGRTLLVTKLEEYCTYQNQSYPLHCDRWSDGNVKPKGYHHIETFQQQGNLVTWTYGFADVLLEKSIWMQPKENTTYIHYRMLRGQHPLKMSLKALVNYRDSHSDTYANSWQMSIKPCSQGITIDAFEEAVPFYLYSPSSTEDQWQIQGQWYQRYYLTVEQYRGLIPQEDHLHAATFTHTLHSGETLTFIATTEPEPNFNIAQALAQRQTHQQEILQKVTVSHPNLPDWIQQLILAADQFIVDRTLPDDPEGKSIIAGYPWFGDWGRDTMISLPGLTITTGRLDIARKILQTYSYYLSQGMLPNLFPDGTNQPAYNTVDAILWYFEALQLYWETTQDQELLAELYPKLVEVIDWHFRGTRYNIKLDTQDGLLTAGTEGEQLTWMDAKVGNWVVTPRHGKPVEVNALWYNALVLMSHWSKVLGQSSQQYEEQAKQTLQGFSRFWNDEKGYCFDVLDTGIGNSDLLRPNQILAVSLSGKIAKLGGQPLLSESQQKEVVDVVAEHLLTSHGLRSLASFETGYHAIYGGDRIKRDGAYHQGTVWGWLIGHFVQAHYQVYQDIEQARSFLDPFKYHLQGGCVGSLSEIFDGNAPHLPRGAFAQAWTVAEVLRSWFGLA